MRGRSSRCLAPDALRDAVARAGLAFRPLRRGSNAGNLDRLSPAEQRRCVLCVLYDPGYGLDVRAEVAESRPDALLINYSIQVAQAAAEAAGVPHALLGHAVASWSLSGAARPVERTIEAPAREGLARADAPLMASIPQLDPAPPADIPNLR